MTSRIHSFITVALLLSSWGAIAVQSAAAQTRAQSKIAAIAERPAFRTCVWGLLALTEDGDTLASFNPKRMMVPASNMKLVTTGTALRKLGPDFRFETRLAYSGSIKDGILNGDLYIIGGGDPSLADECKQTRPLREVFADWKAMLDSAGIRGISGSIVGDPRFFDGEYIHGDWTNEDIGYDYGSSVTGLNFYENCHAFYVSPGKKIGDPVQFESIYPDLPWMKYTFSAQTVADNTPDRTHLINTDMAPIAEMRGTYPVGRNRNKVYYSNRFGAFTCASYFRNYLLEEGLSVGGPAADVAISGQLRRGLSTSGTEQAVPSEELAGIGSTWSNPLCVLIAHANHESDNFYTEAFFRTLGRKCSGSADIELCRKNLRGLLSGIVPHHKGIRVADGSGMSRKNYVSPDFLVSFLRAMMNGPYFNAYFESLPEPGEGSLKGRFCKRDAAFKSRIHMKSGSMNGIRCFSGYILPSNPDSGKKIVFSVMTNNSPASSFVMYPAIEEMIACLAAEN